MWLLVYIVYLGMHKTGLSAAKNMDQEIEFGLERKNIAETS